MDVREDNREEALLPKLLPLIFFNGAFAVAYAGILLREISARTYATELAYLVPGILFLFFAACSGIAGRLFLNRVSSSAGSFPSMLPVLFSAILLPLLLPLLSMTRRSITSAAVLLPLLALPLFFSGLNIHLILKLAAPARSPLLFAIHYLGAAFSGILFAVLVHSLGDTLLLLLLTGLFLVILSLILHLPLLKRMLPCILLLLTALLSSAALIHTACGYLEQRLAHADPLRGKDAIRIDTPYGRAELLRLPDKRFLITNNGQSIATLPINPEKDRLSALTTGIQPDKKRIRVLLICNEFSGLPEAFASMPITASIDVVARDKELLDLSTGLDIMPPESSRFRVVIDDPVHFIDSTFHVYDVIFVEPPLPQNLDADRLFSYEFYKDAYRHLADGGVFATALPAPYGYTRESIAELHGITAATMRKVFPKVIFAPGTTQIAIGGGMNITSDLDTLDARAAGLMAETGFFPEGLLVILHSQVEQQAQTQKIIGRSIVSESNRLFSAPLLINYWRRHPVFTQVPPAEHILRGLDHCLFYRQWIIGGILLLYLLLRYVASTSVTRKCLFFSLENGFYLGGLFTLSMFLFQTGYGTLYRMLGAFAGVLCIAVASGLLLPDRASSLRLWLKRLSILPPALLSVSLLTEGFLPFGVPGLLLFFAGLSGGVVLHETIRRTETANSPVTLWSMELAGAASGILLAAFLVIADHGFIFCIALLMLSRVAHLFAKS